MMRTAFAEFETISVAVSIPTLYELIARRVNRFENELRERESAAPIVRVSIDGPENHFGLLEARLLGCKNSAISWMHNHLRR